MVKVYITFKCGHVIHIDTKESVLEAINVAEFHQKHTNTPDCHFEVWAKGTMIHTTKQIAS